MVAAAGGGKKGGTNSAQAGSPVLLAQNLVVTFDGAMVQG